MTYWRLHYHLIWSTMDRQPLITPKVEKLFYGVIYGKAEELGLSSIQQGMWKTMRMPFYPFHPKSP
jgi:hypothetical protein